VVDFETDDHILVTQNTFRWVTGHLLVCVREDGRKKVKNVSLDVCSDLDFNQLSFQCVSWDGRWDKVVLGKDKMRGDLSVRDLWGLQWEALVTHGGIQLS